MHTVARYTYLIDAQLDQLKLGQHGIESFIADENTVTMQWLYANAIGGLRLQVSEGDVDEVSTVLKLEAPVSEDSSICEKCESSETFRMRMSFWSLPLYLIGFFFPIPSSKVICSKCGTKIKLSEHCG